METEKLLDAISAQISRRKNVSLEHTLIGERPGAQPVKPERIERPVHRLLTEQGKDIKSMPRSANMNIPLSQGWELLDWMHTNGCALLLLFHQKDLIGGMGRSSSSLFLVL